MTDHDTNTPDGLSAEGATPEGATPAQQPEAKPEAKPEVKPDGDPYAGLKVDLPKEIELDEAGLAEFKALAGKHNISPEAAQALLDMYVDRIGSWAEQVQAQSEAWVEQTKADPDIGGGKLAEALKFAALTRSKFGTPELDAVLDSTGLGNHPAVVKFFVAIGKQLSEDTLVQGGPKGDGPRTLAQILYPDLA
jgi:hypothetical protein